MTPQKFPITLPHGVFYGWVIVIVGSLANMVTATMNPVVFSVFIDPMREDLNLSLSGIAWAISLRMLTGGIAAPLFGRVIDRHGARWLGFFAGILAGGVLISLYFAQDIWIIYALFALSGFSGFGNFGGQLLTVVPAANWFVVKRGRATSLAAVGGGAGTAMGVPIALLLINTVGWRLTWVIFGLAIWIVILPCYGLLMRRRPEDLGMLPDGLEIEDKLDSGDVTDNSEAAQEVNWTLSQALRTPVLWFILMALILYMFSTSGVLFLRVPYWNDLNISPQVIALGVAADPFTVIFSMLFFGFLAERYPVRFMAVIGGIWRGISMLPLLMAGSNGIQVFAHNITWGIGSGAFAAAQNLIIPSYYGRMAQGSIRGISLPLMIAAGALGAPAIAFLVDSGVSISIVWLLTMSLMMLGGVTFFFLKPPKPPQELNTPTSEDNAE